MPDMELLIELADFYEAELRESLEEKKEAKMNNAYVLGKSLSSRGSQSISPASSEPFLAAITAIISLITAAAAMVPFTITARSGWEAASTEQMIPVKTKDTPEWGSRVSPRYR